MMYLKVEGTIPHFLDNVDIFNRLIPRYRPKGDHLLFDVDIMFF